MKSIAIVTVASLISGDYKGAAAFNLPLRKRDKGSTTFLSMGLQNNLPNNYIFTNGSNQADEKDLMIETELTRLRERNLTLEEMRCVLEEKANLEVSPAVAIARPLLIRALANAIVNGDVSEAMFSEVEDEINDGDEIVDNVDTAEGDELTTSLVEDSTETRSSKEDDSEVPLSATEEIDEPTASSVETLTETSSSEEVDQDVPLFFTEVRTESEVRSFHRF